MGNSKNVGSMLKYRENAIYDTWIASNDISMKKNSVASIAGGKKMIYYGVTLFSDSIIFSLHSGDKCWYQLLLYSYRREKKNVVFEWQ